MLFNSIEFVLFFPIVLIFYWGVFNRKPVKVRNIFLLLASYLFYGWWDYRFLGLIALSTLVDFYCGKFIFQAKSKQVRLSFFLTSLFVNLGVLFFFKYYGFFARELTALFNNWGYQVHTSTLNIILPVGISFYTFQTLSYTIDIYRRRLEPTTDLVAFATFVSFFPQLVAGPIERAGHLLPQFSNLKKFDYELASNGFRQLLWGFFAKIAVADSVAPIVDAIFSNSETATPPTLILGAVLFSVQIFSDFAGYSNIAIGTAAILGFDLMQNFNSPFFSRNIREFWARWHISLSTWFRDYVYIPLGGNRCSTGRHMFNIMTTFIVSGVWHGANWTFLAWGTIHGIFYLVTSPFSSKNITNEPTLKQLPSIVLTFTLVCGAFVFFRADNISQASGIFRQIFIWGAGSTTIFQLAGTKNVIVALFFCCVLFLAEWIQRPRKHAMDIAHLKPAVRHGIYYLLIFCILYAFQTDRIFIYFQF